MAHDFALLDDSAGTMQPFHRGSNKPPHLLNIYTHHLLDELTTGWRYLSMPKVDANDLK